MSLWTIFLSEFVGTAMLLTFINGAIAANTLRKSGAVNGGWLQVTLGIAGGVFMANSVAYKSGANLNPALSLAFAVDGRITWGQFPVYLVAQFLGGAVGALVAYLAYKRQFDTNDDNKDLVNVFATSATVRSPGWNLVTEIIATFMLVLWVLLNPKITGSSLHSLDLGNAALGFASVSIVIVAISIALGSPTNWAINPARDLGPRFVYAFVLPIKDKGSANWAYAWIPFVGPCVGALLAVPVSMAM